MVFLQNWKHKSFPPPPVCQPPLGMRQKRMLDAKVCVSSRAAHLHSQATLNDPVDSQPIVGTEQPPVPMSPLLSGASTDDDVRPRCCKACITLTLIGCAAILLAGFALFELDGGNGPKAECPENPSNGESHEAEATPPPVHAPPAALSPASLSHTNVSDPKQVREPFIHLYTVLVNSSSAARLDEYCYCVRRNLRHSLVLSVNLVSALPNPSAHLQTYCHIDETLRERLRMHEVAEDPTYKILFQIASAVLTGSSTLAVIAHADLVLAPGWAGLSEGCMQDMQTEKHFFQVSRIEPPRCFPDTSGKARSHVNKNAHYANGPMFFQSMCDSAVWSANSQDAIAFNMRLDKESWSEELWKYLDFHPNRLGAEKRMGCALKKYGIHLSNPCHDLGILHNHCSAARNYKQEFISAQIHNAKKNVSNAPGATIGATSDDTTLVAKCKHNIPKTRLSTSCAQIKDRVRLKSLLKAAPPPTQIILPPTASPPSPPNVPQISKLNQTSKSAHTGTLQRLLGQHWNRMGQALGFARLHTCSEAGHLSPTRKATGVLEERSSKNHSKWLQTTGRAFGLATCRKYHVAVMILGELDAMGMGTFIVNHRWQHHERHIIQPLTNASVAVDTFICGDDRVETLPAHVLERLQVRTAKSMTSATSFTHRQALCFEAAQEWLQRESAQPRCGFSHFLWTRFDHVWFGDVPSLSTLPKHAIALRSRLLMANVEVSTDMMSWSGCGDFTGSGTRLCSSLAATLMKARNESEASKRPCVIVDDQVGVVPASLAQSFFATHAFGVHGKMSPSLRPLTVHIPASPSAKVHVPASPSAKGASHAMATTYVLNVCSPSCWPWQSSSGEGRVSHRLAHTNVSVHLTPMRARLPKVNRHGKVEYAVPSKESPWLKCPSGLRLPTNVTG